MAIITRFIHRAVINAHVEEYLVALRRRVNVLRRFIPVGLRHRFTSIGKFIPHSSSYPKDDCYFITRDKTHFKINRSDYVQWRIFYGVRDNALREAKKHLVPNSMVLDIGANFGAFSLRLATHAANHHYSNIQFHAFEPNPLVFKNYTDNLALNPAIANMIFIHPTGIGNETGERSFQYSDVNTGAGRVLPHGVNGEFTVKIQRLDDFVSALNPTKISFVKIIVEGFEPEVFKGGWDTIKKHKPPLFFEVTHTWYAENKASLEEILDELRTLGYHFSIEHFNEMIPYQPARFAARNQFNLLATL